MPNEYRTINDVMKELGKAYLELGKLLAELDRLMTKKRVIR